MGAGATIRLLPLMAAMALCLFVLKTFGLLLDGSDMLSGQAPAVAQDSMASKDEMAPPPQAALDAAKLPKPDAADKGMDKSKGKEMNAEAADMAGAPMMADTSSGDAADRVAAAAAAQTEAQFGVLTSLAERRKALETRERQLDLRENLLKAAEKRVDGRISELKAIETRIDARLDKRDKEKEAQLDNLVEMYAKMRPKDAARIFDKLDLDTLARFTERIKPRQMSKILAGMDPVVAQRLTSEITTRSTTPTPGIDTLPKIEGTPDQ